MSKRSNHITNVNEKLNKTDIRVLLGTKCLNLQRIPLDLLIYLIVSHENSTKGFCQGITPGILHDPWEPVCIH